MTDEDGDKVEVEVDTKKAKMVGDGVMLFEVPVDVDVSDFVKFDGDVLVIEPNSAKTAGQYILDVLL